MGYADVVRSQDLCYRLRSTSDVRYSRYCDMSWVVGCLVRLSVSVRVMLSLTKSGLSLLFWKMHSRCPIGCHKLVALVLSMSYKGVK